MRISRSPNTPGKRRSQAKEGAVIQYAALPGSGQAAPEGARTVKVSHAVEWSQGCQGVVRLELLPDSLASDEMIPLKAIATSSCSSY